LGVLELRNWSNFVQTPNNNRTPTCVIDQNYSLDLF
jgi:hypothetical protein